LWNVGTAAGRLPSVWRKLTNGRNLRRRYFQSGIKKAAARNCLAARGEGQVKLAQGDLLAPTPETVDIIVANLPYVLTEEVAKVNTHVSNRQLALDGGVDGSGRNKKLCVQAKSK